MVGLNTSFEIFMTDGTGHATLTKWLLPGSTLDFMQ